jgi:hypothetical protein
MAASKTTTLTFRIEPSLKEALRIAADSEHRSVSNMVEVMIREFCERNGIAIDEHAMPGKKYKRKEVRAKQSR